MVKVLLADDQALVRGALAALLGLEDDIEVVAQVGNGSEVVAAARESGAEVCLIDIEMPILNGFELLQEFNEVDFKVIFTTAYDQYAIKALKINALDYLLKPIDSTELRNALDKDLTHEIFTSNEQIAQLNQFNISQMAETLALSTQKGLVFIKIKNIMYFEADGSYTHVYMNDGTQHLVSKSLSNFEEVLQDNPLFFRSHKSNLVNLNFIKQYIRGEGGELIMQNDKSIVLSRNKKQEFLNLFRKI